MPIFSIFLFPLLQVFRIFVLLLFSLSFFFLCLFYSLGFFLYFKLKCTCNNFVDDVMKVFDGEIKQSTDHFFQRWWWSPLVQLTDLTHSEGKEIYINTNCIVDPSIPCATSSISTEMHLQVLCMTGEQLCTWHDSSFLFQRSKPRSFVDGRHVWEGWWLRGREIWFCDGVYVWLSLQRCNSHV